MKKFKLSVLALLVPITLFSSACYVGQDSLVIYGDRASYQFIRDKNLDDPILAPYWDGKILLILACFQNPYPEHKGEWIAQLAPISREPGQYIYVKSARIRSPHHNLYADIEEGKELTLLETSKDNRGRKLYGANIRLFDDIKIVDPTMNAPPIYIDVTYEKDGAVKMITFEVISGSRF